MLTRLRTNKVHFKHLLADIPGLEFRDVTDTNGECATVLTVLLPNAKIAERIAHDLKTRVASDSAWHVYSNMDQILNKWTATREQCPFNCGHYTGNESIRYERGMLPQTDELLQRAINISIGVSDPGLGTSFGVTIRDDLAKIEEKALEFRRAVAYHLN